MDLHNWSALEPDLYIYNIQCWTGGCGGLGPYLNLFVYILYVLQICIYSSWVLSVLQYQNKSPPHQIRSIVYNFHCTSALTSDVTASSCLCFRLHSNQSVNRRYYRTSGEFTLIKVSNICVLYGYSRKLLKFKALFINTYKIMYSKYLSA